MPLFLLKGVYKGTKTPPPKKKRNKGTTGHPSLRLLRLLSCRLFCNFLRQLRRLHRAVHGFQGAVVLRAVGARRLPQRISPGFVGRVGVGVREVGVCAEALREAHGAAEELHPGGLDDGAQDA